MPLDNPTPDIEAGDTPPAEALQSLSRFPLLDAIFGRRSRRFGVGMEIPDGPFAFKSRRPIEPIGPFERNLLIAIGGGVSGLNFGIPHAAHGEPQHGCDYALRNVGRTYPSGAAVYGSELLVTDDSGSYITKLRDFNPSAVQAPSTPAALVEAVAPHVVRLSEERVVLPPAFPHIGTHNHWVANKPGTTLFVPVSDQAETLLNLIWIYTAEGSPILDDDGRPIGDPATLLQSGVLLPQRAIALRIVEAVALKHTTAELTIAAYNIQLALQAMGLGGWLYTGINAVSLLGGYAQQRVKGFGFRFSGEDPDSAVPLGLDGHFEPLVAPYAQGAPAVARRFLERKFGARGVFGAERPSAHRDDIAAKSSIAKPSDELVSYFTSVIAGILDRHGRFPVSIAPVGAGIYTQAHHIDTDFYDQFYKPGAYLRSHADHAQLWHGEAAR